MNIDLMLIILLGLLAFLAITLKTNIALALLTACAGFVVADLTSGNLTDLLVASGVKVDFVTLNTIVGMSLTVLPSLMILFRFSRFQPGRLLEHVAPAAAYSLLLIILTLIWLPADVSSQFKHESYIFSQLEYFQVFIVISAVVIAIFDMMAHEQRLRRKARRGRRKLPED